MFNISQQATVEWLGWEDDSLLMITLATTLVPVGACFGALSGGISATIGRRKHLIALDIVAIAGLVLTCIPVTAIFMLGRFISGISAGGAAAVCPIYNSENSPARMRGRLGALFEVNIGVGVFVSYLISLPILWLDTWWLIFIFGFPILPALIQLLLFATKFKYEPHPWSLKKGKLEDAKAAINLIYFEPFNERVYDNALIKSK